jgi:hypothetical protein
MTISATHGHDIAQPAPEAFTDTVLQILASATWPDGSRLVEVDEAILRRELGNKIRAAAYALAGSAAIQQFLTASIGDSR